MRVVIDAMGTPAQSGGMNLYARELVTAWSDSFPDDAITVVGGRWANTAYAQLTNVDVRVVEGQGVASRLRTQVLTSGRIARRADADALLSLSPMVSPLMPRRRRAAVVHDWRHIRRPQEFGAAQRLYRRLWERSLKSAGVVVAISEKTARETLDRLVPRELIVIPNGGDHPRGWARATPHTGRPFILTYGHFRNKRPEAVIDALAALSNEVELVVLGAAGEYRQSLVERAGAAQVGDRVRLPGYVAEDEYRRLVQQASVLVLNSSDEGFGLPASEAAYFGTPVVVASDSGLAEIHGASVIESAPDPISLAAAVNRALSAPAGPRSGGSTWAECATAIRARLLAL